MENILLSLNVMLPVFLTIITGVFLQKINLLPKRIIKDVNNFCFKCCLPLMLFNNVRATDFTQTFDLKLIGFAAGSILILFIMLCVFIPRFILVPEKQSVVIQGFYRSNYVIFGIPIIANIYGNDNVATITMLIAVIVPMFNLLAVILFEKFNRAGNYNLGKLIINILKNPLIVATFCGFLVTFLGIPLPTAVDKTLKDIGAMAVPLALLILGADLDLNKQATDYKLLTLTVLGRLLLVPAIFLPISVAFGFRGEALAALLVLYASPAAVAGYVMAQNAGADHHLAGQIVVFTSLLSCLTFFILIAFFKSLALI